MRSRAILIKNCPSLASLNQVNPTLPRIAYQKTFLDPHEVTDPTIPITKTPKSTSRAYFHSISSRP